MRMSEGAFWFIHCGKLRHLLYGSIFLSLKYSHIPFFPSLFWCFSLMKLCFILQSSYRIQEMMLRMCKNNSNSLQTSTVINLEGFCRNQNQFTLLTTSYNCFKGHLFFYATHVVPCCMNLVLIGIRLSLAPVREARQRNLCTQQNVSGILLSLTNQLVN